VNTYRTNPSHAPYPAMILSCWTGQVRGRISIYREGGQLPARFSSFLAWFCASFFTFGHSSNSLPASKSRDSFTELSSSTSPDRHHQPEGVLRSSASPVELEVPQNFGGRGDGSMHDNKFWLISVAKEQAARTLSEG